MNLKRYLETRRFTKKEFARLIGVSSAAVSNYICKKRKPALDIAIRIEQVTDGKVTAQDLFNWWESKDNGDIHETQS
jgi:predicted transcriptional regulator